ncbi:MAG: SDR family oxidoreductase [Smithellaceae bacterium]|nr:SDR family oxidoreductase [Smithellaceae bacterium]
MGADLFARLFSLQGKTALISGGYKGIGRMFAETYAEAGANVAIVARNLEGCMQAASEISGRFGVKAIGLSMDIRKTEIVNRVVREVVDAFGRIDILVNNAGITGTEKPVLKMSDEDLDDVMSVDFRGAFVTSRAVAGYMVPQKSGRIINVSSILGKIAARNMTGYCASKAAAIQLTKVMALELIRDNIQVNALCPGYFLTDFNREFFNSEAGTTLVKKMIPINRVGNLDELRSTALFLATCPSFLTGAEIYVDGGHTLV